MTQVTDHGAYFTDYSLPCRSAPLTNMRIHGPRSKLSARPGRGLEGEAHGHADSDTVWMYKDEVNCLFFVMIVTTCPMSSIAF